MQFNFSPMQLWNTLEEQTSNLPSPEQISNSPSPDEEEDDDDNRAPNRRPKGTGRKRIERLQRIENKLSRKVAFSKRRKGLFKKAKETCQLCPDSQVAVLVYSAKGRLFSTGFPSGEVVVDRFLNDKDIESVELREIEALSTDDDGVDEEEEEVVDDVEEEELPVIGERGDFWYDLSVEDLDDDELEEFVVNLEGLENNLCMRLEELIMRRTCEVDYLANFD